MTNTDDFSIDALVESFGRVYPGRRPELVSRACGRVELIGGHTDYNDGFIIAAAIDKAYWVAASRRDDSIISVYSEWKGQADEFDLTAEPIASVQCKWANYGRGVAAFLLRAGLKLHGADLYVTGNVPVGAGLSSSAALEVSLAGAMLHISGDQDKVEPIKLAEICQQAENVYADSPCGIMDQVVCIAGLKDQAIFLDCRDLSFSALPLEPGKCCIMIFDSRVHHEVGGGEYGKRRQQCNDASAVIAEKYPDVKALRDVDEQMLASVEHQLDSVLFRRAKHVVGENARVLATAEALKRGDIPQFGQLMYQSHKSASDLYEISCEEIDFLVEQTRLCDGVYGARLCGGGFGGAVVAIVKPDCAGQIKEKVGREYKKRFGIDAEIYIAHSCKSLEIIAL